MGMNWCVFSEGLYFSAILPFVTDTTYLNRVKKAQPNEHHNTRTTLYEHRPSEEGFPSYGLPTIKENAQVSSSSFHAAIARDRLL